MANDNKNKEQVIRLDDIMYILLKHFKTMLGLAVLGFLVGILISFAFYIKGLARVEYYVTASIAVTSTNENGMFSANSSDPNATDIHLAEDMTDSVIYVCKSDTTLNAAAERLQLIGVTADDIRPNLSLSQYEKTQIIEMRLVWDNPDEGVMILNAITEVVPNILIDTLKIGNVSVVNPPKVKTSTLSFINVKIVAVCFLIGAIAAAGYYLIKHFIHPTFLHADDVKDMYDLDILGEIPGDKQYFNMKVNSFSANDYSSVQEYFSACAHVLVYRLQDIDNVCVYITSSASQEGKSSITASIGYALAKLGYKTLLLDLDVRNPSLASKFIYDRDDRHTLNAVYFGDATIDEAIVKINSNLDILPTKLEDKRLAIDYKMLEIISIAKTDYDFVIIDTAPVGQVSDSMSINQAADCAIFVVRQDQVWISAVTDSIERLRKSGIALLGAIMNDTKDGSINYYHSNYKQFADSPYVHLPESEKKKRGKPILSLGSSKGKKDEGETEEKEKVIADDIGTKILKKRIKELEKKNAKDSQSKKEEAEEVEQLEESEISEDTVVEEANSKVPDEKAPNTKASSDESSDETTETSEETSDDEVADKKEMSETSEDDKDE
ncbi:MAG: AAA family ATPase [Clostridia bacterium]|nr:AAA family ATPase [Clostridia bacterium]